MTMAFRTVKDAVVSVLGAASVAGGFRVIGYNDDAIGSDNLKGAKRLVQVYNQSGDFKGRSSGYVGSISHDPVINIDLTTAMASKVDLSVLNDPDSTASEIAAVLEASGNASDLADTDMDQFVDTVYQILMSPINLFMGLPVGTISNRWIPRWEKSKPMDQGGAVIVTCQLDFNYQCNEDLTGETPKIATEGFNGQVAIGDDIPRAAVKVPNQ